MSRSVGSSARPRNAADPGFLIGESADVLPREAGDVHYLDLFAAGPQGVEQEYALRGPGVIEQAHEATAARGRSPELRLHLLVHDTQCRPRRVAYGGLQGHDR